MKKLLIIMSLFSVAAICEAQEKNVRLPEKPVTREYKEYSSMDKGWWCSAEYDIGTSLFVEKKNFQGMGLSFTNGYRFNEFLRVGLSAGVRYYFNNNEVRNKDVKWAFPLSLNVRGNIISMSVRNVVPYWSMNVGAVIRDGFFMSPTIGIRLGEERSAMLIGISYNFESTPIKDGSCVSAAALHIGYEF